jgi:hypothetical protein
MRKKITAIAGLDLRNIRAAYIITIIGIAALASNYIVNAITGTRAYETGNISYLSMSWALWLLPVFAAIFIPAKCFQRTVNLGAKRRDFFWSSLTVYVCIAAAVALVGMILTYCIENPYLIPHPAHAGATPMPLMDMTVGSSGPHAADASVGAPDVFGWISHGLIAAFFQQFSFLLLFSVFVHTLVAAQGKWYGWAADCVLIAIVSVFPAVDALRPAIQGFFHTILFAAPHIQIPVCLVLAAAIYALSKLVIQRKAV